MTDHCILERNHMMKPKITILFGSPRHKGYTKLLLEGFFNQIDMNAYDLTILNCYQLQISPCIDCKKCTTGSCPFNQTDDLKLIIQEISSADYVILATPIYFAGYPAPLKAVIDRFQQFFQNPSLRQQTFSSTKQCFLFFTAGDTDPKIHHGIKTTANLFFRCINSTLTDTLILEHTDILPPAARQSIHMDYENIVNYFEKSHHLVENQTKQVYNQIK